MIPNAIIAHLVGLIGPYEAQKCYANRSWGNTPLKVDKNLQWMSHHPTAPTYIPVLSGTMTQSSSQPQKAPPGQHKANTCIPKI